MENKINQMVKIQLISRSKKNISILLFVEEGKDNCLSRKKEKKKHFLTIQLSAIRFTKWTMNNFSDENLM